VVNFIVRLRVLVPDRCHRLPGSFSGGYRCLYTCCYIAGIFHLSGRCSGVFPCYTRKFFQLERHSCYGRKWTSRLYQTLTGTLAFDANGTIAGAYFELDMNTITITDKKDTSSDNGLV
jgi:hypothetical protein